MFSFLKRKKEDVRLSYYKGLVEYQSKQIEELEQKVKALEAMQENEVLQDIHSIFVNQTEKGIKKYGDAVRVDNLSTLEWIDHALQEQADNMVYLTCLKQKLIKGEPDGHSS